MSLCRGERFQQAGGMCICNSEQVFPGSFRMIFRFTVTWTWTYDCHFVAYPTCSWLCPHQALCCLSSLILTTSLPANLIVNPACYWPHLICIPYYWPGLFQLLSLLTNLISDPTWVWLFLPAVSVIRFDLPHNFGPVVWPIWVGMKPATCKLLLTRLAGNGRAS